MTAPTLSDASAALARLDDGLARPGDRALAGVLDVHCQPARFCLICGSDADSWECTSCVIAAEVAAKRAEDI